MKLGFWKGLSTNINIGKNGGLPPEYYQNVISLVGRSSIVAYYVKKSGTSFVDVVNGLNGSLTNASDAVGIGDGQIAAGFTGTGYGSVLAAKDRFNGTEGTFTVWAQVSGAGDWTDGAFHVLGRQLVDANNFVSFTKDSSNGKFAPSYKAGGGILIAPALYFVSNTGWFNAGIVWSKTGNFCAGLYNGARFDPRTASGDWAGVPTIMSVASNSGTSASVAWKGSLAHYLLLNRALTEWESCQLTRLANIGTKTISILGDSISVNMTIGYQLSVLGSYNGGNNRLINHAAGGQGIITYMALQAASAVNDDADIVIIELGTNDSDNSNITSVYAQNISTIKASNPRAIVYGMGILNKTDETNRTINNARISQACSNAGAVYWNTDGWINPATDLSDGVHPNAAGYTKITTQILARI